MTTPTSSKRRSSDAKIELMNAIGQRRHLVYGMMSSYQTISARDNRTVLIQKCQMDSYTYGCILSPSPTSVAYAAKDDVILAKWCSRRQTLAFRVCTDVVKFLITCRMNEMLICQVPLRRFQYISYPFEPSYASTACNLRLRIVMILTQIECSGYEEEVG